MQWIELWAKIQIIGCILSALIIIGFFIYYIIERIKLWKKNKKKAK